MGKNQIGTNKTHFCYILKGDDEHDHDDHDHNDHDHDDHDHDEHDHDDHDHHDHGNGKKLCTSL